MDLDRAARRAHILRSVPSSLVRAGRLVLPAILVASFAGQVIGALLPRVPLLIAATAVGLAAEAALHRWHRPMASALARTRADVTVRVVLRDLLLVAGLLAHQQSQDQRLAYLPLVLGLLTFYALHFACHATALVVRRSRTLPVLTRNIDTSGLRLTTAAPALLSRRAGGRLRLFGFPATAGLMATALVDSPTPAIVGVGLAVLAALVGLVELLTRLLPARRPAGSEEVLDWFDGWLAEYQPTVALYFSGGTSSAYQANMWLDTLARLDGRPLIVLRERFMVQKIGATDLPIVCVPKVADLMRLEHSTLPVMLHPANSGKTSQVLRIPTIKHAFVNHGESDKLSSVNPYSKAYDEVWVAGPAARDRYAQAEVGVEDKDIVEVGRPQLDGIRPYAGHSAGGPVTVLYAPTWEGWDGNPGNTSVIEAGENLVRELLADPGVRLLYKPHPMTGSVDARAGAANTRIQEMIRAAVAGQTAVPPEPAAAAELEQATAELDLMVSTKFRRAADDMERMLLQTTPVPGRAGEVAAATARWEERYWASLPPVEHQIVTGSRPALYSCFDQADLLVSDVSSVVSDYLASGKPYAVANTSGLPEDVFRETFPTVGAATILSPDGSGVARLLDSVRRPGADLLVGARAALRTRLLGPAGQPSLARFDGAVKGLAEQAAQRARIVGAIPSQALAPTQEATEEPLPTASADQ
ncbi:hypothetical protein ACFV0R_31785 [Streptomyces sp. NPDC059578]|uniref:hypothetical protein n=1 Tax=Streptomyces sp. NPDC059578 TaxID=3346874 RepID=UPI0036C31010